MTADTIGLTERQQEVLELLRPPHNMKAREIGERLGVSRNAVYQTINRLKRDGIWRDGDSAAQPRATEAVLTEIMQPSSERSQVPLSAQLLSELQQTQQELARIANRLAKYLS